MGLGRGWGALPFRVFSLSFDFIFFFHPPPTHPFFFCFFFLFSCRSGRERGRRGRVWGWDCLCGSKVGGKGNRLILPTRKGGRRSLEVPGFITHAHLWLFAFPLRGGVWEPEGFGEILFFRERFFFPLHLRGFEAQQSAGMGLAGGFGVCWGCSPFLGPHLLLQGHPGVFPPLPK